MNNKNVWKVGMTHSKPKLMLKYGIAYAYGGSMPTYLNKMNIASIKIGDIIILAKSMQKGIDKIGIVSSNPYYCLADIIEPSDYLKKRIEKSRDIDIIDELKQTHHTDVVYCKVNWLEINTKSIKVKFNNTYGFTQVLDKKKLIDYIMKYKTMNESLELLKSNKNLILTGAPGTGKTYLAKKIIAKEIIKNNKKINSIKAKNDLVKYIEENIKKGDEVIGYKSKIKYTVSKVDLTNNNIICLSANSITKIDCQPAGITNILKFLKELYTNEGEIKSTISRGDTTYSAAVAYHLYKQIIKEYCEDFIDFVQFHPSYDYTDFVEGLRPVKKGKDLGFELKNGTFKEFCKRANNNPNNDFVFIIDEINRAEISKVFGELFFSIDPGYRGVKGKVKTQYENIQEGDTVFDDKLGKGWFYVPENVYIIGTMNDIDRSVESFDFAMRRRFAWKEIIADERTDMWNGNIDKWKVDANKKMKALNQVISNIDGLNSSYHIGPAYFLKLNEYKGDFDKLWKYHIEILLQEYLRGMNNATENLKNAYFNS